MIQPSVTGQFRVNVSGISKVSVSAMTTMLKWRGGMRWDGMERKVSCEISPAISAARAQSFAYPLVI